jgi:hypothetical protein
MHPVTRLGRVLQQVRSFTSLHASELEGLAAELEAAGQGELAARLRVFQGLHSQEAGLILDELADVRAEMDREMPLTPRPPLPCAGEGEPRRSSGAERGEGEPVGASLAAPAGGETAAREMVGGLRETLGEEREIAGGASPAPTGGEASLVDPAANSPKRARWLAEQARQAEEARRPRSRRDLFTRGS